MEPDVVVVLGLRPGANPSAKTRQKEGQEKKITYPGMEGARCEYKARGNKNHATPRARCTRTWGAAESTPNTSIVAVGHETAKGF